jgi:hypothetical protein
MEKSWSLPVAQTLQRHTGSWKLSPLIEDVSRRYR